MRHALDLNRKPENRNYRYNFLYDNCATRPVLIENSLQGIIRYASEDNRWTFRDIINYCTHNRPWIAFGCELVFGLPTDRLMTKRESFIIPDYLSKAFGNTHYNDLFTFRSGSAFLINVL